MKEQLEYWEKIISKKDCEYYEFHKHIKFDEKYPCFILKCIRKGVERAPIIAGKQPLIRITMQNINTSTCFNDSLVVKEFIEIYKKHLLIEKINKSTYEKNNTL